jgi:peptidoglycan hydrolase CwlO-like protein
VTTANDPWGRVDADGTVYVRTADGERMIGSWQAGSPEEALAFFRRKYEALETEVALIEQRMATTDVSPAQAQQTVQRLLVSVTDANALGDLEGLKGRLEALTSAVDHRREEVKAAREHARAEARDLKERIVEEAEHIAANATHWKASGERMAELLEEWKAAPHAERAAEAVLWKRLSAARNTFTKRRKAYFAQVEAERDSVRARKERLVQEAEALQDSTDWGPTTSAYRELMRAWKEAGRAGRDVEAELWKRFRDSQDKFFAARTEVFAAKETELRQHAQVKEELLAEAQGLLPVTDLKATRAALRSVQERWEMAGPVPRESRDQLEGGLRKVEDAVRRAEDAQWKRSNPEALKRAQDTVNQIRTAISSLEDQLARATERGDNSGIRKAEEAIAARRSWLVEAERTLAEFAG